MQSLLIGLAADAGADVARGKAVRALDCKSVSMTVDDTVVRARLIVGADGRQSRMRRWAGFTVSRDPPRLLITGALLARMPVDEDTVHTFSPPTFGQLALFFPLGHERVRGYFTTIRRDEHKRLTGAADLPTFVEYCVESGAPVD